jgi:hypothetical protein
MNSRRASFDHLVGADEEVRRNGKAERLRGLEIDRQLVLNWRLHRQVGGLFSFEDAVDVAGGPTVLIDDFNPVPASPPD